MFQFLINASEHEKDFVSAEAVLEYLKKRSPNSDSIASLEYELYLRHAKALNAESNSALARNYVNRAKAAFERCLRNANPSTAELLKQRFQAELKQYGLAS